MKSLTPRERACAAWVARNRGILSRIARAVKPPVTPQAVHLVLRGLRKSTDGRIEKALAQAGAPK